MVNTGMQKGAKQEMQPNNQGMQPNQQGMQLNQQGIPPNYSERSQYPQRPSQYGQLQPMANSYMANQSQNQSHYRFVKPKDYSKTIFINEGGVMRPKNS